MNLNKYGVWSTDSALLNFSIRSFTFTLSLSLSLLLCLSVFTLANVRFHKMWYLSLYPYLSFVPSNSLHLALCGALSLFLFSRKRERYYLIMRFTDTIHFIHKPYEISSGINPFIEFIRAMKRTLIRRTFGTTKSHRHTHTHAHTQPSERVQSIQ